MTNIAICLAKFFLEKDNVCFRRSPHIRRNLIQKRPGESLELGQVSQHLLYTDPIYCTSVHQLISWFHMRSPPFSTALVVLGGHLWQSGGQTGGHGVLRRALSGALPEAPLPACCGHLVDSLGLFHANRLWDYKVKPTPKTGSVWVAPCFSVDGWF